ncbi:hypothetical protein P8C59_007352 [Phyllachora maydis]|uniref:Uncharacterized protein n=1 Tax=Phyllachora maydis TaxID=1825666 RepID=A0AAD9I8D7_9PEZI|nr:hypothetical protein P8C59_007352 [Phyllachora maydis]
MLIRHVHSLAKTFPVEVGREYREMLKEAESSRPLGLDVSDLIILTGIGTTFPTSDHFHQVVTPAMLCIGRYLGQKVPQTLADYAIGLYLVALVVQYHQLAKRYVPEAINFALNVCALGPVKARERLGLYPHHEPPAGLRIQDASHVRLRRLDWNDCQAQADMSTDDANSLKAALLGTTLSALQAAAELWAAHPAFLETFQPVLRTLEHLSSPPSRQHLPAALAARLGATHGLVARLAQVARLARRPLELHHHRPRAVRTVAPRWDDGDGGGGRARDEPARLRAELRRERKGAVRELRRDASFVARENLRRKRAQDDAYAEKYRRLVTEIQNEEGRAANEYEREKKKRQRRR